MRPALCKAGLVFFVLGVQIAVFTRFPLTLVFFLHMQDPLVKDSFEQYPLASHGQVGKIPLWMAAYVFALLGQDVPMLDGSACCGLRLGPASLSPWPTVLG